MGIKTLQKEILLNQYILDINIQRFNSNINHFFPYFNIKKYDLLYVHCTLYIVLSTHYTLI